MIVTGLHLRYCHHYMEDNERYNRKAIKLTI